MQSRPSPSKNNVAVRSMDEAIDDEIANCVKQEPTHPVWEYEEITLERGNTGLGFSIGGGMGPYVILSLKLYFCNIFPFLELILERICLWVMNRAFM